MRKVEGGTVYRDDQQPALAAAVERIDFPSVGAHVAVVPAGAVGTMYLRNPPPQIGHYDTDDTLRYQDGNHNNDATLVVTRNHGPTRYDVLKQ